MAAVPRALVRMCAAVNVHYVHAHPSWLTHKSIHMHARVHIHIYPDVYPVSS